MGMRLSNLAGVKGRDRRRFAADRRVGYRPLVPITDLPSAVRARTAVPLVARVPS